MLLLFIYKYLTFEYKEWDLKSTESSTFTIQDRYLMANVIELSHSRNVSWSHSLNITKHKLAKLGTTSTSDSLWAWAFNVSLRCAAISRGWTKGNINEH